jgi:hypothetical protein
MIHGLFSRGKDSMLKVNSGDSLFNNFILAYNSHQQYKFLHETGDVATLDRQIQISTDEDAIPVFNFHEEQKILETAHKTVIINAGMEGSYIFQLTIHNNVIQPYPADKKCIFFSDSSFDRVDAAAVNCLPLVWPWFLLEQLETATSNKNIASSINLSRDFRSTRLFNFCSLIGFEREERDILVNKLLDKLINRNFVMQYASKTLGQEPIGDIKYTLPKYNSYQQFDILNATTEYYTISKSIPIELYNNSNFMLVVENQVQDNIDIHVTEKITKALITGIPFIIFANKGFIEYLHSIGFKTYNTLWSESYDSMPMNDRFDTIVDLINSLDTFDWIEHADELAAIANHNKLNFFNLNKHMISAFNQFDKYIYDVL